MLMDHLTVGAQIIGLRPLIMKRQTATAASYRVRRIGPITAIEFFDGPTATTSGETNITTLPYKVGTINNTPMTGAEVISGEFAGCIMARYKEGGVLKCGHVCTQSGYSQRDNWNSGVQDGSFTDVTSLDTKGLVANFDRATMNTSILCVASATEAAIGHVYVEKEAYGMKDGNVIGWKYRVVKVGD